MTITRTHSRRGALQAVQGVLLALTVSSLLVFASWTAGYNGLSLLPACGPADIACAGGSNVVPHEGVLVEGRDGVATVAAANGRIGSLDEGTVAAGDGSAEFFGNQAGLSFWGLTTLQHLSWGAVRGLPALGLAAIWWLLFRVVRDVRRGAGFSAAVSRRLAAVGALVLFGMPVAQLARWLVGRWLVESSEAGSFVRVLPLRVDIWPIVVGVLMLVLAAIWREAARMRADLEGLV